MVAEATASYPLRLDTQMLAQDPLSMVCVTKVMSLATPLLSVSAMPVTVPSLSFKITVVSSTSSATPETLACRVMSTWRRRVNSPLPVTSTVEVSMVPSMYSIVEDPVMSTSLVLDMMTSVRVKSLEPSVSIPIALFSMLMLAISTAAEVREPYLKAAPADPVIAPVKSPPTSDW